MAKRSIDGLSSLPADKREKFEIYSNLLLRWQRKINLIGPSTTRDIWNRHFEDSFQLMELGGDWRFWVDLGSGAGFPGLVIAIADLGGGQVHLVESDRRKAAFLQEVSRETSTPVIIHVGRIETLLPQLCQEIRFDVISARALAPMARLIDYARPALEKGAVGLFLKGKALSTELTELAPNNNLTIRVIDSRTEPDGNIVVVRAHKAEAAYD